MKIAFFARDIESNYNSQLIEILQCLINKGVDICLYAPFFIDRESVIKEISDYTFFNQSSDLPQDVDIFVTLGGDGTFLESLTIIYDRDIPVLGVNFGRLGFLTGVNATEGTWWIDKILTHDYCIDSRALLKVESDIMPNDFCPYALNELSFQRKDPSMLSVKVFVDNMKIPTYWSDGLIISTPTGSTAYSLSVGGPIVLPGVNALIIAPISPHNLNVRPLIISDSSKIEVTIESRGGNAIVSLDNRSLVLPENRKVSISKSLFEMKYISLSANSFIAALKEKLMWGQDKRTF